MASWLDKARGRRPPSKESVPFQLDCDCGSRISGVRMERAKRQVCSQCGAAHFILPQNQYPQSERSQFPVVKKSEAETEVLEADLLRESPIPDESTYGLREPVTENSQREEKKRLAARRTPEEEDLTDDDGNDEYNDIEADLHGESSVIAGVDEKGWQAPQRRRKSRTEQPKTGERKRLERPLPQSPRRFLPVAIAFSVLAAGMIYWVTSSRSREQAEIQLKGAMDTAEKEFFDGNYSLAYQALLKADESLRILGVTDERTDRVRHMKRHADASTHRLDGSIMELVETASQVIRESGGSTWKRDFSVNFEGRWLVMQIRVPHDVTERSRLTYDWIVDGRPIQLDGLGTVATWAAGKGELKEMICAARLSGCRHDPRAGDVWAVEFDPQTAFLWTDETSLIRQNMIPVVDDAVASQMRSIIRRQLEIGDAPPPPPPLEEKEEEKVQEKTDGKNGGDSDET